MSYKRKLQASQDRAHRQNIATKIDREMRDLRSQVEDSPSAPRRWVWELIQNAKDVHHNGSVNIQIEFDSSQDHKQVVFRHTGKPFTADNIRFLIEQISTKDRKKDEYGKRKTTGKFGTGFLSTHLLSEVVTVNAIAKEPDLEYRQFELKLDRSGFDLDAIDHAVQEAKQSVENLDELAPFSPYDPTSFNTAFTYPLIDKVSVTVAQKGIKDLQNCLPYTLLFVPEINQVSLHFQNEQYQKQKKPQSLADSIDLVSIGIAKSLGVSDLELFSIATLSKGYTSISLPVKVIGTEIYIQEISEETPRLFCDFPLVGTEVFPFPVIINNPHFNPTDSRDGIFLTGNQKSNPLAEENREILENGIELYFQLLEFAAKNKWKNLHHLANIRHIKESHKWVTKDWFGENVLKPIRQKLLKAKIVNPAKDESPVAMLTDDGKVNIWFPTASQKEIRVKIWGLASHWFPGSLPRQSDVELWYWLAWKDCGKLTTKQFADFVEYNKSINELSKVIAPKDCIEWLNDFYDMLKMDEEDYDSIINSKAIFPNQHGNFCKCAKLFEDSGEIGSDFKDILTLFGNDIRKDLAHERIAIQIPEERQLDRAYAIKEISAVALEKSNDREIAKSYRTAFNKLLNWFRVNPASAKELFPVLHKRMHLLYDEDAIMESMGKAEQLEDLLTESGAKSVEELKQLIQNGQSGKGELLPITQEILASMGITSIGEWEKALEDKDLAALFDHESVPTTDMFVFAQSHIRQAKENIIQYLCTLEGYDVSNLEETAPTVLAGIQKNGRDIQIVARPAYTGEVIIYYTAEQDILDFEESELWVDDGIEPRQISLGYILKKAQIKKFPI